MAGRWHIRDAEPGDLAQIAGLEQVCFPDPWSKASLRDALATDGTTTLVATSGDRVWGYLIAREAGGSGEILNLAVAPDRRRSGVGAALLDEGLARLRGHGNAVVFLEVRESNAAALDLYRRRGFWVIGMRKGYYRSPAEDGLVLRLDFPASE